MPQDWARLRLFHQAAEARSLTEAAHRLGMSQPALSRQVKALEEALGAKLFHRHARGLALTHEGEELHHATTAMAERLEGARGRIEATRHRPTGPIRLSAPMSFGAAWLSCQIAEFLRLYPDIRVDLLLSDEDVDLARREADCAIRFQRPRQAELIQRPLSPIGHRLCASEDYLARHGEPADAADLDRHRLVAYGPEAPASLRAINWVLDVGHRGQPRVPVLTVNNSYGVLRAVEAGAGIAALPLYLLRLGAGVRPILPQVEGTVFETFFVYPVELRGSVRVGALRDFLVERMVPARLDP